MITLAGEVSGGFARGFGIGLLVCLAFAIFGRRGR